MEEIADSEIHTFLKAALEFKEEEGQSCVVPEAPSYRDFDHVIETAYAVPLLREMRSNHQHKNAVKGVVREFLEQKTFALQKGLPVSFDRFIEGGFGKIALGNLARGDVIAAVRKALLPELNRAINTERSPLVAQMVDRNTADSRGYQALKKHVLDAPQRSNFDRAAFDSADELRVARLLDQATDVEAWVFNHRSGIAYSIEYDWQGMSSRYFPDFIVRAKVGEAQVIHNFIIEVKGAYDDRDRAKAQRGQRYCELLTDYDHEPWHYLLLIENDPVGRRDISWWDSQSRKELWHLYLRQEKLPLFPSSSAAAPKREAIAIQSDVPAHSKYRDSLPVHDLAAAAGGFSPTQAPEVIGWARVQIHRDLDSRMFVARVRGRSMEPAVPDGAWAVFRLYAGHSVPSPLALDGKRVVVELRGRADPDTGGAYTLKRWRVTARTPEGAVAELTLMPDNPDFEPIRLRPDDGDVRVIAELIEVVG
jgi:SOS-response transcriptional repressor LexA